MKKDRLFKESKFSSHFSVEDWNSLIKKKLGKYFKNETVLEENKEILRTEIINFIRVSAKPEYFKLFEWTYSLIRDCLRDDKQKTINILAGSFYDTSNTDMIWMTNALIQPDPSEFSERDKISYHFNVMDLILEGVFKPRFILIDKLAKFKLQRGIIDNSNIDFGKLVKDFPNEFVADASLLLKDPIYSLSTNQWRNIAAHKSFNINKHDITVEYGKSNIQSRTIPFEDFYKIFYWTQDMYRAIRLAQVLTDLNYVKEIVTEIGGTENLTVRFESSLFHIIHNMQIVGFEFVSTEEQADTFCLTVKSKKNHDLRSSIIHASQCLDQLSCAIYDDKFVKDNFQKTKVCVIDESLNKIACATVTIEVALKNALSKINEEEYIDNIEFEVKSSI